LKANPQFPSFKPLTDLKRAQFWSTVSLGEPGAQRKYLGSYSVPFGSDPSIQNQFPPGSTRELVCLAPTHTQLLDPAYPMTLALTKRFLILLNLAAKYKVAHKASAFTQMIRSQSIGIRKH
jgi:hypothetical protein